MVGLCLSPHGSEKIVLVALKQDVHLETFLQEANELGAAHASSLPSAPSGQRQGHGGQLGPSETDSLHGGSATALASL